MIIFIFDYLDNFVDGRKIGPADTKEKLLKQESLLLFFSSKNPFFMETAMIVPLKRTFFLNVLKILEKSDKKLVEIWYKPSEIPALKKLSNAERVEFLSEFDFIQIRENYILINKISFIADCASVIGSDLKTVSKLLDYRGFEGFICEILKRNGFSTLKNFRFSDKSLFKRKTNQIRYEIDIVGIFKNYVLLIDAKQWNRKDSFGAINKAANLQYQRAVALKENLEVLSGLVLKILGNSANPKKLMPLTLFPIIVALEDSWIKTNENQVPLVSIYTLNAFLQEFEWYIDSFQKVVINKIGFQSKLF